jgi:2-polyprenyl-3-methyl-5-hydroxy-6-metoxy-1,4-benzoquinol methylase
MDPSRDPNPGLPAPPAPHPCHVCPWWLGGLLASPLRRLVERPERVLEPHIREGMAVVEPGSGMGYYSLPIARADGPGGRVLCLDLQPRMLQGLVRRARRAGLADRIETAASTSGDLGLRDRPGCADLAVVVHMLHEVPDPTSFLGQIRDALRPGGRMIVREPPGHVSGPAFEAMLERPAG